ncbi:hypothetical protein ACDY99_12295 [Achromobacter dolens]|jgi:hypothetical protein|uniref:hypothetical protein n=1 Tax=Achromobacter dolens TaxID=1287738 RepID=UPI003557A6FE
MMIKLYFAPSPHDAYPNKISPPKTFDDIDIYPAVTITAPRKKIRSLGDVVQREDELGTCLVAHFEVRGTLLLFYQSALDPIDHWTIFVDMNGCVARGQYPTLLGTAAVRFLSQAQIKPDWTNAEADTEFRSRRWKQTRRKHLP